METGIYNESEKKRKLQDDREQKEKERKKVSLEKKLKSAQQEEKTTNSLSHLQEILEGHGIDAHVIEKIDGIAEDNIIDEKEIEDIMKLLAEFENDDEIQNYITSENRITKDDFLNALVSVENHQIVLQKLDNVLGLFAQNSSISSDSLNTVGGLAYLLDKKLVYYQEAHIDMKHKLLGNPKKSFWRMIAEAFGWK